MNNDSYNGGGLYVSGGSANLDNVTLSGNVSASRGGGINIESGSIRSNNVTLVNNLSSLEGGGIYYSGASVVTLRNSILAHNTASISDYGPDCNGEFSGMITSQGYNLIGNNSGCTFTSTTGDLVGTSAIQSILV